MNTSGEDREMVLREWGTGSLSSERLAVRLNMPWERVRWILRKARDAGDPRAKRGKGKGSPFSTNWTPEQVAQLRELWALGLSCSQIGLKLRTTKNVIIGKARRLSLPRHTGAVVKGRRRAERYHAPEASIADRKIANERRRQKCNHNAKASKGPPRPPKQHLPRAGQLTRLVGIPAPPSLNLTLLEIADFQCHWIAGNDHRYCGHPTSPNYFPKPYCEAHGAMRLRPAT